MADRQQESTSQPQMQTPRRCEYIAPGRNSSSLTKTEWTLALWNIEEQRNFATKPIDIAGKYSTHTLTT
ncbi:hypothetical protein C0J52_22560 [Blattella germanica]|nr:hypothetical protein C0J52_22560 [Blattella germanica]